MLLKGYALYNSEDGSERKIYFTGKRITCGYINVSIRNEYFLHFSDELHWYPNRI